MPPTNKRTAPNRSILGLVYQIEEIRHGQKLREVNELSAWEAVPEGGASATPAKEPTWHRSRDVKEYVIEREGLLFHPGLQLLSHLNETAMYIWQHCEGLTTETLVAALAGHFGVEPETARRHVTRTLELFSVSGFVAYRTETRGA